jgi:nucleoside-diphosphate-sugar epimerase
MGPGDQRITPTYVDNCNYGHILAAEALANPKKAAIVGGQSYNVNDAQEINFFDDFMFKVGSEVAGVPRSKMGVIRIPFIILYIIATIADLITKPLGIHSNLTRFSIIVICRNRIFSTEKAKRDFGYEPIVPHTEAMRLSIASSKKALEEQKASATPAEPRPKLFFWLLFLSLSSSLGLVQALLGDVKYIQKTQFNLLPEQGTTIRCF